MLLVVCQALVMTHELSRKDDMNDFFSRKLDPLIPMLVYGRSYKASPICKPQESLFYGWKDHGRRASGRPTHTPGKHLGDEPTAISPSHWRHLTCFETCSRPRPLCFSARFLMLILSRFQVEFDEDVDVDVHAYPKSHDSLWLTFSCSVIASQLGLAGSNKL